MSDENGNTQLLRTTAKINNRYSDPPIYGQNIGLVSFIPSNGASPDDKGIYGMMKLRGVFATQTEANEKAEDLVKNHDSYTDIYHVFVGKPFPITNSDKYVYEKNEVDINNNTSRIISNNIKLQKDRDNKIINELKDREEMLLQEVTENENPYNTYTELQIKKAHLSWTYKETIDRLSEVKKVLISTRLQIIEMDNLHEDFQHTYRDKYMKARELSGLPCDEGTFMKFLGNDNDHLIDLTEEIAAIRTNNCDEEE
jgi:hypothetical protein